MTTTLHLAPTKLAKDAITIPRDRLVNIELILGKDKSPFGLEPDVVGSLQFREPVTNTILGHIPVKVTGKQGDY